VSTAAKILASNRRLTLAGVPEGLDARILADLAGDADGWVLHIARDDARLALLADAIAFFRPDAEILRLPAWDTLPYDRTSPIGEISAARMSAMARLCGPAPSGPGIVLTTVNAALQKMPARDVVAGASLRAAVGDTVDLDTLANFLARNGFTRTGTVMEPGEYAVRGGIHDIFPAGTDAPMRLDFFGDQLESVRLFDPLTQRTIGTADRIDLVPVSEVVLSEEAINRFRAGYRELFGAVVDDDPLYAAVSAGRHYAGMENWLPLFHERLDSLFDYLPDAPVTLDHLALEARDARLSQIDDFYQARVSDREVRMGGAPPYNPVPPARLYLDAKGWDSALHDRTGGEFSQYSAPPAVGVIDFGGRQGRNFAVERGQGDVNVFDALRDRVEAAQKAGQRAVIACFSPGSADRMCMVLADHGVDGAALVEGWDGVVSVGGNEVPVTVLAVENGFETDELVLISEQDILGDRLQRRRGRSRRAENFITEAAQIAAGDLVVHVEHGIGRYEGLQTIDVGGAPHDCLQITYDGGDRLYVPVENIEVLSRYGSEDAGAALDKLGGANWQSRKARLKERIREMADELIKVAAERLLRPAPKIAAGDGMYDEFCARFPFEETDDQLSAIADIIEDLSRGAPMDRLVCGDVGFGKTEVALRTAFAVAMSGGQVAVVAPTTLLSRQHFKTFSERFAGFPVRIGQMSRLVSQREATAVREGLANGDIDIVVGTHALLGKNIKFKNLTLLVIDEEQHFGVAHKERLKQLRSSVHVLTLTATPIPRTLQLAFSGVKELSLIATPPVDRLSVRTFVTPFDPVVVREAILREHLRGGQVFYVCPRIADLPEAAEFLREHVPEVKVVTAHGQLPAGELEDVMGAFYDGEYDVLLSTTIVESGLDIPSANTMIVHRADMFGLAQLYQLRGRIGRSKVRGYAYLTLPPRRAPTEAAEKRLKVLQSLDHLGAGFSLASHDLDIRGAGNLLGDEQSGHIREVGFELYQHMLEEALAQARSGEAGAITVGSQDWSPNINLGMSVMIPDWYVADLNVRLGLYRRIAHLEQRDEIDSFAAEMIDRFGALPEEFENLLKIVAIKKFCRDANVEKVDAGPGGAIVTFRDNSFANPAGLVEFINKRAGIAKLRPDHKLVYKREWDTPEERMKGVHQLVHELARVAQSPAASSAA
jgi:transcription-repair coupling factor (superfamily II helicase)